MNLRTPFFFSALTLVVAGFMLAAGCVAGSSNGEAPEAGPGSRCDGSCYSPSRYDAGYHDASYFPPRDAGPQYPDGSTRPSSTDVKTLGFDVVDARQSTALDALVLVSKSPASILHVFHTGDGTMDDIALPDVPTAVALDPSGKFAAVGHHTQISYVDLVNKTVMNACAVTFDVAKVAIDKNAIAYAVPKTDQFISVHPIDLNACVDTGVARSNMVGAASPIVLHPAGTALLLADAYITQELQRCTFGTDAGVKCTSTFLTMQSPCGRLWLSPDGTRLYTGCGNVFQVPPDVTFSAPQFAGKVGGPADNIQFTSWAANAKKTVVQPMGQTSTFPGAPPSLDTTIRVYDDSVLTLLADLQLPMMPAGATSVFSHGKFAFTTANADKFFVIVQADPPSLAYALVTLTP